MAAVCASSQPAPFDEIDDCQFVGNLAKDVPSRQKIDLSERRSAGSEPQHVWVPGERAV